MKIFETPQQVKFKDEEHNLELGGIAYNDFVICGECGDVLPLCQVEIIEVYDDWISVSDEIVDMKGE